MFHITREIGNKSARRNLNGKIQCDYFNPGSLVAREGKYDRIAGDVLFTSV